MPKLRFGPYLPDLPSLGNPGSLAAKNVIPSTGSYRPLASLEVASEALSARCQGMNSVRDTAGNVNVFAGSAAKLERLSSSDTSWEDVSGATYGTPSDETWDFAFDGKSRIVGVNGPTSGDVVQSYVLGSSTDFGDLDTSAPSARSCAFVKGALMCVNTNDGTNGHRPNAVMWPKRGDPTAWETPGSSAAIAGESDERLLNGAFGQGMCIRAGLPGADAVIWQEGALWRVTYVGGDIFYTFDLIDGAKGTIAKGSISPFAGGFLYLAEDGWYATDGQRAWPVGTVVGANGPSAAIDKTFFSELDPGNYHRISAIPDPINKAIIVSYPANGNNGTPNRGLVWNWTTGWWSYIDGIGDHEILVTTMAVGYSLDDLDAIYPSIDDMSVTLDSRSLTGGRVLLGAVDTSHQVNTFTGANMAATLTTSEQDIGDGQRALVTEMWPLVEGSDATITVTPIYRNRLNDDATTGTAVTQTSIGHCPIRVNSRYMRGQVDIAAGGSWDHAVGVEIPGDAVKPMGKR